MRIEKYVIDTDISPGDKVIGTDSEGQRTKNYLLEDLIDAIAAKVVDLNKGSSEITIDGEPFLYRKRVDNNTPYFVQGDISGFGWTGQQSFGTALIYQGPPLIKTTEDTPLSYWRVKNEL